MQIVANIATLFIGWVVVHLLSVKREKDKEKRQLGEKIIGFVEELATTATAYHTRGPLETEKEKIMTLLAKIERGLHRMHLDRSMQDNIHLIELRLAVTYVNFGNDPYEEQSENSEIIAKIATTTEKMISFIDDAVIKIS